MDLFFCFFFCFYIYIHLYIHSLRNIRSQLFFSRFLLFPAFCTSFSLPPFILATIFCSSTRGRSFILPSSCLLDGTLLILFRYFLKLYLFTSFVDSILTYILLPIHSHVVFSLSTPFVTLTHFHTFLYYFTFLLFDFFPVAV